MHSPVARLRRRTLRTIVATALTAAAVTAGAVATATAAPAPSPQDLQSTLVRFSDPNVSTGEKETLIVNGRQRESNIDKLNQGLQGYGTLGYDVTNVQADGDTATATVAIASPHGTVPGFQMSWQHSNAGWQISDNTACLILAFGRSPC